MLKKQNHAYNAVCQRAYGCTIYFNLPGSSVIVPVHPVYPQSLNYLMQLISTCTSMDYVDVCISNLLHFVYLCECKYLDTVNLYYNRIDTFQHIADN